MFFGPTPVASRPRLLDGIIAFGAALMATTLEAVGRFAWEGPYLPELAAQKLFALIPPWAFTPLFRFFGYNSKYYAFAGMITAEVGGLTLLGAVVRGWFRARHPAAGDTPWGRAFAVAGAVAAVSLLVLLPILDAGVAGQALPAGAWVTVPTVVVVAGSYTAILTWGVLR